MLPFEAVSVHENPENPNMAADRSTQSNPKVGFKGFAGATHPSPSIHSVPNALFRPHSRPVQMDVKTLGYKMRAGIATPTAPGSSKVRTDMKPLSRSIMLPSGHHSGSGGAVRINTNALSRANRTSPPRGASPQRDRGALSVAMSPSPLKSKRRGDDSSALVRVPSPQRPDTVDDNDGLSIADLCSSEMTAVDRRRLDIDRDLPCNTPTTVVLPTCRLTMDPPIVLCEPGLTWSSSAYIDGGAFAVHHVTVEEVGIERALEYVIYVESPALFSESPQMDPVSGVLTFATAPDAVGLSVCWLQLCDNAMILDDGSIAMADPIPFVVAVGVERAAAAASLSVGRSGVRDWKSHNHKAHAHTVTLLPEADETPEYSGLESPSHGDAPFNFPPTTPHQLRFEGLRHELLEKYSKSNGGTLDQSAPAFPKLCELTAATFPSVVSSIEASRSVQLAQALDNLGGEPIERDSLATFESKLLEKLRNEEKRLGTDHPDTVPLLLRCAQLYTQWGARRQGDAAEALERVARIRMGQCGIAEHGLADDAIRRATLDTEALRCFEQYHNSLTTLATYLKITGQYHEALEFYRHALSIGTSLSEANGEADGAATPASLGSNLYLRSLASTAEVEFLLGQYSEALTASQRLVALSEVQFGPDAAQTNAALLTTGLCFAELNRPDEALRIHMRVIASRKGSRQRSNSVESNYLVADALFHAAMALVQRPGEAVQAVSESHRAEGLRHADEALKIFEAIGVYSSVEATLLHSSLLMLVARVYSALGDTNSIQLCQRSFEDVVQVRGESSLEAAIIRADGAICHMNLGMIADAAQQLQGSLDIILGTLGSQHPTACRVWLQMAQCLLYNNRQQALIYVNHSQTVLRKRLGTEHRDYGTALEVAARVQLEVGRYEDARQSATEALNIAENTGHKKRMLPLETLLCCGCTATRHPMPAGLLASLEARVRAVKTKEGTTSQTLILPLQNLAEAHYLLGDFADAHHQLSRALKIADSLNMVFLLGHLFKPSSQLAPSEVEERNRMAQDRLNPVTALTFGHILFGIASVFEAEGKLEDCQLTYLQAQAALEIAGSHTSMSTVEVLVAIGRILFRDGHFGDALAYFEKSHNLLLEHHPKEQRLVELVEEALRILHHRLHDVGYTLLRHVDNRHKFTTYV